MTVLFWIVCNLSCYSCDGQNSIIRSLVFHLSICFSSARIPVSVPELQLSDSSPFIEFRIKRDVHRNLKLLMICCCGLHLLPVPPQATAEANNLTAQAAAFDRYIKEMDAVRHRHTHLANNTIVSLAIVHSS